MVSAVARECRASVLDTRGQNNSARRSRWWVLARQRDKSAMQGVSWCEIGLARRWVRVGRVTQATEVPSRFHEGFASKGEFTSMRLDKLIVKLDAGQAPLRSWARKISHVEECLTLRPTASSASG